MYLQKKVSQKTNRQYNSSVVLIDIYYKENILSKSLPVAFALSLNFWAAKLYWLGVLNHKIRQ